MATAPAGQIGRPIEIFQPMTFGERGASVPFTSPQLAGARVRMNREQRLEIVLPNPGGRGSYVCPWRAVGELCQPTAHDARLIDSVGRLSLVLPRTVRCIARAVVAEGFAGRPAQQAAKAAIQLEVQTRQHTHDGLLLRVIEEGEPSGDRRVPASQDSPANPGRRSHLALSRLAETAGCGLEQVTEALEDMADHFSPIGLGDGKADAYVPRVAGELAEMRAGLCALAAASETAQVDLKLIVDVLDVLLANVGIAAREALDLTQHMGTLVRRWRGERPIVQSRIATAEWLLDGWDRIYGLWRVQRVEKHRGLPVREIAGLLPLAPSSETLAAGMQGPMQNLLQDRHRRVAATVDWQNHCTPLDRIEHYEALLVHAS